MQPKQLVSNMYVALCIHLSKIPANSLQVYYTSLALPNMKSPVMHVHVLTEEYLKQSGLIYTIIREGITTDLFPFSLGMFNAKEVTSIVTTFSLF